MRSTDSATEPAPTVEDRSVDHASDVAAIRALVADVEAGFNTNDPDLLVRPFIANGSAVNVAGVALTGRAEMRAAAERGLAGPLAGDHARYELADLVFLRPDVAVGHKLARAVTADGELIDAEPSMIALYVFVKEGGRWWVAARQNTAIAAAASGA
ncbi:MAG TPA: SgcJ/EcaC family oxidoreductase [Acidimicrobiales bacterium]